MKRIVGLLLIGLFSLGILSVATGCDEKAGREAWKTKEKIKKGIEDTKKGWDYCKEHPDDPDCKP